MAFSKAKLARHKEVARSSNSDVVDDPRVSKVENAVGRIESPEKAVEEITSLWRQAQEKFLAIGRYLLKTKDKFPKAFEREVIAKLPFGYNVAHQLMSVARAVDSGVLKPNELPRTYSVAYHLTTLSNAQLLEARRNGLVSPDVSRRAIIEFKKAIDRQRFEALGRRALLERERDELRGKLEKLQQQASAITNQIKEIEANLLRYSDAIVIDGRPD
ncbi:hypothetical protein [Pseudoroseomonas ludipueritiae]|uniref:DUF3102 domain-containing protein n=1 Tax=Pseudoroseomonas ludipueritiae TaxID=198093 RepID=A0ABR7RAH9_9PROT|nr:hypothetical protein [Pseudoroseomonas ludipueritiae]MBC9178738.1 hypothetical protein [Pseudoroseomonas ludipueritiae]